MTTLPPGQLSSPNSQATEQFRRLMSSARGFQCCNTRQSSIKLLFPQDLWDCFGEYKRRRKRQVVSLTILKPIITWASILKLKPFTPLTLKITC